MASEQLKAMFMKRMFEQQQSRKASKQFKGMMGTPSREIDVHRPDENSPFGLMNVESERQEGTGLFNESVPMGQRYNQLSDKMIQSGNPLLQQQGMDMMGSQQGQVMGNQGRGKTTFAYGSPDGKGQMQRGYLDDDGQVVPVGDPYDPRNMYLDTGTGFENPNDPNARVKKNLYDVEQEKAMGVADTRFFTDYVGENRAMDDLTYDIDQTIDVMDDMAGLTGYNTVGFGSWLSALPMTEATDWQSLRDTVTSKLALTKMMQLKQASSTGSTGFGALSEKELKILIDNLANLGASNTPQAIKRELKRIYDHFEIIKAKTGNIRKIDRKKYQRLHKKIRGSDAPEWKNAYDMELPPSISEEDLQATMKATGFNRNKAIKKIIAKMGQ